MSSSLAGRPRNAPYLAASASSAACLGGVERLEQRRLHDHLSSVIVRRQYPAIRPSTRMTRFAGGRSAGDHGLPAGAMTDFVSV